MGEGHLSELFVTFSLLQVFDADERINIRGAAMGEDFDLDNGEMRP